MGNIEFRNIVNTRKEEYLAVPQRDHVNKNRIALEVVAAVRAVGGRFLKRAPAPAVGDPIPGEPEKWVMADEKAVVEKAKQALRQVPSSTRRRQKEEKRKQQEEEEEAMKLGADTLASIGSQQPQQLQSQQGPPPHYNNSTVPHPHQMYNGYTNTNHVQQQQQHPQIYNNTAPAMYAQPPNSNSYGTSMPQGYNGPVPIYQHNPFAAYSNLPVHTSSDLYGRINGGTTNVHNGSPSLASVLEQQQAIYDQAIYAQRNPNNNMQEDKQQPWVVNQSSQGMLDPAKVWMGATAAASAPSTATSAVGTNATDFESLRKQLVQQATMEAILEQKQLNSKLKEQLKQGLETATAASNERYQQEIRTRQELEQQMKQGIEVAARAASMLLESEQTLLRGQSSDNQSLATIDMSGRSGGGASVLSASEILRLQELFDGATTSSAPPLGFVPVAAPRTSGSRSIKSRHSGGYDNRSMKEQSVKSKESTFISGLEDMSLPSTSMGEISDFTEQQTRTQPVNNNPRRSSQDSIAEGSEHSSVYSVAFQEEAQRARSYMERLNSKSSSVEESRDPKRPSSQKDVDNPASNDEESESRLQAIAALAQMCAPTDMDIAEETPEAQTSPPQLPSAVLRKKQRKSLSSYYREMKANESGHASSITTDNMCID